MREKPVYITIPENSEFTLNKTKDKAFDDELVSDLVDIGFDGVQKLNDNKYTVGGGKIGKVTQYLYDTLTGIQWGKLEDSFGWTYPID